MTTRWKYLRGTVVLGLLVLTMATASPAHAGTGASMACSDGMARPTGTEIPILDTPITLALEVGTDPYLFVCYSTTAEGNGSPALTGGYVLVEPLSSDCAKDSNPLLVAVECEIDSNTIRVRLTVQGTPIEIGISYAFVDDVVCLRRVVVTTPTGSTPALDIGVCDQTP